MATTTSTVTDSATTIPDFLTITPIKPVIRSQSGNTTPMPTIRQRQQHGSEQSPSERQPQPATPSQQAPSQQTNQKPKHHYINLPKEPLPKILEPLLLRITFFLRLWTFKILGTLWLQYHQTINPQPRHTEPDQIKTYPTHPNLPIHIFFPPTHKPKTDTDRHQTLPSSPTPHPTLLPLYIDIHGGGLTLGTPTLDHTFSRSWSTRTNHLVVSLSYPLTPLHPFPVAPQTISTLAHNLINDPTLPIDKARIAIGGFSAGGLLALSAPQLSPLKKDRVKAVVAYYPATDFSEYPDAKFAQRLDTTREWEVLHALGGALDWGYVMPGQDRRDRILSPLYAEPDDLPERVCVIGSQYDMFCREGRDLIFKLAGKAIDGDGGWKEGFEAEVETRKYKWVYASGMAHGFTEVVGQKKGRGLERRRKYCDELYQDVHQWLESTVV